MNSPCLGRQAFVCGKQGTGRPKMLCPQGLDSTEYFKTELLGLAAAGSPQEHLYLPDLGGVERRPSAGGAEEAKSGRGKSRGSGIRTVWHGSSAGSAAWWTGRFRRSGCPARGKCPCILPRWGWAVHRYPGFRLGAYESSASSCPATADTFLQYRLHSDGGPAPLPMNITHCQHKSPNFILRAG